MSRELTKLVAVVVVAVAGLVYTFAAGNEPLLGLDLQGGVSVVYEPADPDAVVDDESLGRAVEIIRNRVDGLGVAEPEITRQGETILVQLPGVEDQDRALELIGQTAELRFRPVLDSIDEASYEALPEDQRDAWTLDTDVAADDEVVLPEYDEGRDVVSRLRLGPSGLEGNGLESASARFVELEWAVAPVFRPGSPGIDDFNALAGRCFNGDPSCPTGRVAVEIDDEVISAPGIQAPAFERDSIIISGAFDEAGAKDLALALNYGALPIELEAQETRVVSATIGEDALDAGVVAGLIGLGLVSIYLLAYYRLLGLVAIASLAVSAALLWTIVAWMGESQGLALTLAGVTGLIVSIGVSVDSNVVYFETLKEDVRHGRTLRSSVQRSFPAAFSTIVKADVASLIAAGVLYFLTVGSVRGFALFLGLATLLDLVATYFFMGPAVRLLAGRTGLYAHPARFGIPSAPETDEGAGATSRSRREEPATVEVPS